MIETILKHDVEIIDIKEFKKYFNENLSRFDGFAKKAFLKAVDIPPAYFLEQPEDTKTILLNNKEDRINSMEKYIGKCIVILWKDGIALNACRMDREEAENKLELLSTIEDVEGIVWDKTFYKDGYIQGYVSVGKIAKENYNRCVVIDFPILLNKDVVLHDAFFKMPTETSIVPRDLFYYNNSTVVDFADFQHISLAVESKINEAKDEEIVAMDKSENNPFILRETAEVLAMLVEDKILPKTVFQGILGYVENELEGVQLTVNKLTEVVLSYEGNLKSLKQVTSARDCYNYLYTTFNKEAEKEVAEV